MAEEDELNLISQNTVEEEEEEILTESVNRQQPVASLGEENEQNRPQDVESSSDDEEERDDYAYPTRRRYGSRAVHRGTTWWFQEPAVKRNLCVVLVAWGFVCVGIACFVTGIGLEVAYHGGADDIIRGFVFVIVACLILLPSLYVVTHVYLAAKRAGRVRFSSVWFFTK